MKYVVEHICWFILGIAWMLLYALIALLALIWYFEWRRSVTNLFGRGMRQIGEWMHKVFHEEWRFTVDDEGEIKDK